MLETGTIIVKRGATHIPKYLLPSSGEVYEIIEEEGDVMVKSGAPQCVFCGRLGTVEYEGKTVCRNCIDQMKRHFKEEE